MQEPQELIHTWLCKMNLSTRKVITIITKSITRYYGYWYAEHTRINR